MKTKTSVNLWESAEEVRPEAVAGVSRRSLADSLFKAVVHCNFHRTSLLLRSGVSPRVRNDDDQNLLMASLYINNDAKRAKMFEFIAKKGASLCHVDAATGRDVLAWAAYLGRADQVLYIVDAVSGEVDLQRVDNDGMTPLHHAVIGGHHKVVEILVEHMVKFGLNVDIPDKQGLTPYIYARRLARLDIAFVLSKQGNCSRQQLDSKTFRSVDEWERIGRKEKQRLEREKELRAKHLSRHTRNKRKRLAPVTHRRPCVKVSFTGDVTRRETGGNNEVVTILSNDMQETDDMTSRFQRLMTPNLKRSDVMSLGRPTSTEVEQKLQRSVGNTKLRPIKDNLSTILGIVSAQCCESFRKPVSPPTPPPENTHTMTTATLAMMFGRKGRGTIKAVTPDPNRALSQAAKVAMAVGRMEENVGEKRRRKAGVMSFG